MSFPLTFRPEIDGGNLVALVDQGFSEIKLAIEFERARLYRQRARSCARLRGFVDDAHLDTKLGQPKRQNQAGGPRADNQNVALCHFRLRTFASPA